MSTFTVPALATVLNMEQPGSFDVLSITKTGTDEFGSYVQWNTSAFITVRAYSADLVVDVNNVPVSGSFTLFRLFGSGVVTISDIAIDVTSLSYTSGAAANDANWEVLLRDATTFAADPTASYAAYGDINAVLSGTYSAGADTFTGSTNDVAYGDAKSIGTGATLNGGDDVFNVISRNVYGDTKFIAGDVLDKATLNGGDDTIIITGDVLFTRVFLYGDAGDLLADAIINGGNDVIDASLILSTSSENILIGDGFTVSGTSTIVGGNDTITGSQAVDTLYGDINSNNSVSSITGGDDILDGQGGADRIYGDYDESRSSGTLIGGNDMIRGGSGNDIIQANAGDDWVDGGADDDQIDGGDGIDTLSFASATAAVTVSLAINVVQNTGGGGSDTITHFENIEGTVYRDKLTGNDLDNVLQGGRGNDVIAGGLGSDTADWSTARRSIVFTLAADGSGVTANVVGINIDTLTGIENLSGGTAADQLTGNAGNNTLNGNGNADTLNGEDGDDRLNGGIGNDVLNGGLGRDTLLGSSGKDTLNGGDENDNINAGSGADLIDGGAGNDIMSGTIDLQADEFYFRVGYDSDRVNSYEQGIDELHLDAALWGGGLLTVEIFNTVATINAAQSAIKLDFGNGDVLEIRSTSDLVLSTLIDDIVVI